ncbi:MAG: DUF4832 domain-containing protein [Verrucomicrobia bacterium]|nr:DUF4832 domain-containing protein [Verrucomicrobiota bacterium]
MDVCDREWRDVEKHNIKVIPRVYLHWDGDKKYWPSDMQEDDYSSDQFKQRVMRLISRLGECWDNDPRVAWVQMGIIGKWGEHHSPGVSQEMQKLMGDAFTKAFRNKLVTVRHPWEFESYEFGIYWDSWAHIQQVRKHGGGIEKLGTRWQTRPMGGECAYNWGRWKEQPGDDPNDTLQDTDHRSFLINTIRRFHCNNLGWVAEYDPTDPIVRSGAGEVQKAFGYRFILEEFEYPAEICPEEAFDIVFKVRNTGSSPFYADWPVEISLLDTKTREVVWRDLFKGLDIRQWQPGDGWDNAQQAYRQKSETHTVRGSFKLPPEVGKGEYIMAVAILDPAGMLPSARFAIQNYFKGGRHPLGRVGVGVPVEAPLLSSEVFDDPAKDRSLHYILESRTRPSTATE